MESQDRIFKGIGYEKLELNPSIKSNNCAKLFFSLHTIWHPLAFIRQG